MIKRGELTDATCAVIALLLPRNAGRGEPGSTIGR